MGAMSEGSAATRAASGAVVPDTAQAGARDAVAGQAIRIEGLTRRYGRTVALDGVSLGIDRGITGLVGPNGAGKTTLLSILATVASPDAGRLSVFGWDPCHHDERVQIRRRLGYVPQELGFHRHFRVAEFLDYVAILKEIVDRRQRRAEVARVLAAADLAAVAGKRLRALSGGTKRRVGLAQALLGSPDLLVLDEPVAGLDPEQRLRFRELLSGLPGSPAVVLSTHQADDVAAICSRVVVLLAGKVCFTGTPQQLAGLAAGRVWVAAQRDMTARLSWRGGDGSWRHIGAAPPRGARGVPPTVEDGYLLLSGVAAGQDGDSGSPGLPVARRSRRSRSAR
jgi:ABC-2 type transport system ATP-binding protein